MKRFFLLLKDNSSQFHLFPKLASKGGFSCLRTLSQIRAMRLIFSPYLLNTHNPHLKEQLKWLDVLDGSAEKRKKKISHAHAKHMSTEKPAHV